MSSNEDNVAILRLAPFTPIPKLYFQAHIGQNVEKEIQIENPNPVAVHLVVTKLPPIERFVNTNWLEITIQPNSSTTLILQWSAQKEGNWRDIIQIMDNKKLKRDIVMNFTCEQKKNKTLTAANRKIKRKQVSVPAVKKRYSPKNIKKKSPPVKKIANTLAKEKLLSNQLEAEKENVNVNVTFTDVFQATSSSQLFDINAPEMRTSIRRETYNIKTNQPLLINNDTNESFDDSLVEDNKKRTIETLLPENKFTAIKSLDKVLSEDFEFSPMPIKVFEPIYKLELNQTPYKINSPLPINKKDAEDSIVSKKLFNSTYNLFTQDSIVVSPVINEETQVVFSCQSQDKEHSIKITTSSPVFPPEDKNYNLQSSDLNTKKILLSCITEDENSTVCMNSFTNENTNTMNKSRAIKRKLNMETVFIVSPPKRSLIMNENKKQNNRYSKNIQNFRKSKRKIVTPTKIEDNSDYISEIIVESTVIKHKFDPFLIVMSSMTHSVDSTFNPFMVMSDSSLVDEICSNQQIREFEKWLNVLLTPPVDLQINSEDNKINVAKIWQDCIKNKSITYAPTKEIVSSQYHVNHRLETLRKSANSLFKSIEIQTVLNNINIRIKNKKLLIREDKNLHLDVGLQSVIMDILLCYNPLWLRIGLETIFNEHVPLKSNSDFLGLSTFILFRIFRCSDLVPKKKIFYLTFSVSCTAMIKEITLQRLLYLIYFLDQAKTKKLIGHDPCLFCRNATIKESQQILTALARELFSAVGDIRKFLKRLNYNVNHKQNYFDEFDYAVKHLSTDLKDGIRLTKVMEIILIRNDLVNQLRGPAISRLQKIHNVKIALDSLVEAGFTISGNITPNDIVDGNQKKTLLLLWQIIFKFQAPRLMNAIKTIQMWWRSLPIILRRRHLNRPYLRRCKAATTIQRFYRCWVERKKFVLYRKSITIIQRFIRSILLKRRDRLNYLKLRQATIIIQKQYRSLVLMKEQRFQYLRLRNAAIYVQRFYRNRLLMKVERKNFLNLKKLVIRIQWLHRSKKILQLNRNTFIIKRKAAITIQTYFRAFKLKNFYRNLFLNQRSAAIVIQNWFRAIVIGRLLREAYQKKKQAAILIQRYYRCYKEMEICRKYYLKIKKSIIIIQQIFRANYIMKKERKNYLLIRKSVRIIQIKFRAYCQMKEYRQRYLMLKKSTIYVQRKFRANIAMKKIRYDYLKLKMATIIIQKSFRARKEMKKCKEEYLNFKKLIIFTQRQFRALMLMKQDRENYLQLKKAVVSIQRRFRANVVMKQIKKQFYTYKQSAICIQKYFRAYTIMKHVRENYLYKRKVIIKLQKQIKANLVAKHYRKLYLCKKSSAVYIQQWYRNIMLAKRQRNRFLELKNAAIIIQQQFRANLLMKKQRNIFLKTKQAAMTIQYYFRSYLLMKTVKNKYIQIKNAVRTIQYHYRNYLVTKEYRKNFIQKRTAAIKIQKFFKKYLQQRAVIKLQSYFRMILAKKFVTNLRKMKLENEHQRNYKLKYDAALKIQTMWRGYQIRKKTNKNITVIREKFSKATSEVLPSQTIREKYVQAIEILNNDVLNVNETLRALAFLDFTTRLFPHLCIDICDEIADRLYEILFCSNRSEIDKDINTVCLSILINLYKFPSTSAAVWKSDSIEELLTLLLHWSDKDGLLFPRYCTLIWLFANNKIYRKKICETKNSEKILRKAYILCERKQKMLKKMRNVPKSILNKEEDYYPSLYPDWGICNQQRPRTFFNPMFAITSVLKILNITYD